MIHYPADIYLLKVNNRNTRTRREICSKLTIKITERRQWHRFGVFIVNFEHISHLSLVFLLSDMTKKFFLSGFSFTTIQESQGWTISQGDHIIAFL